MGESFRRICTDQVFHAKLCLNFPVMIVDVCLDRYRQHENSACQMVERAGQADAALETYLTWLESYVAAQPIVDPTVRAAARRALRRYRHPWLYAACNGRPSATTPACVGWPHEQSAGRCRDRCDGSSAAVSDDGATLPHRGRDPLLQRRPLPS